MSTVGFSSGCGTFLIRKPTGSYCKNKKISHAKGLNFFSQPASMAFMKESRIFEAGSTV
jgi:hypothetical protein